MKRAGVAQLKASLSEFLAVVKSGEEVIITERGHPIARITPISSHRVDSRSIEELTRAGILSRPLKKFGKNFLRSSRPKDPKGAVLEALLREREESR